MNNEQAKAFIEDAVDGIFKTISLLDKEQRHQFMMQINIVSLGMMREQEGEDFVSGYLQATLACSVIADFLKEYDENES